MASEEVAALVKDGTDLVALVGEVAEGWGGRAPPLGHSLSVPLRQGTPCRCRSAVGKGVWHCFGCGLGGRPLSILCSNRGESLDVSGTRGRCGIWVRQHLVL